jgi:hypothetical protein
MPSAKSTTKPRPRKATTDADDLDAFALHFSEVLRIASTSDVLPVRFYNALADAWCDLENATGNLQRLHDSEEYIRYMLRHRAEQGGNTADVEGGE